MEIVSMLIVSLIGIAICHTLAKKRGANTLFWSIMGGLFGPLAIPFCLFSGTLKSNRV